MRFGEIQEDGSVTIRNYGEGNNWRQNATLKDLFGLGWGKRVEDVWRENEKKVMDYANEAKREAERAESASSGSDNVTNPSSKSDRLQ
ncbi:hypothetical protein [Mesorhizobium sp. KR9-304]|uniref:hypothetical protein n=1 Tax=Mesorhizobium sp. KR9-304 TaxID=3156614 RepID=UPI0032B44F89